MPNVSVAVTPASGLFTFTTLSGTEILLGPTPITDAFPGDTSVWAVAGAPWAVSGDKATMDNTTSANNYLTLTYGVQQATAEAVTFRVKANGAGIASGLGNNFGIELILTDSGGLGGTILATASAEFPSGTFPEQQFSITATPASPAYYVYAYIFARSGIGQVTVWDAEVYQANGTLMTYGTWASATEDLWAIANTPMTSRGLSLKQWGFYYGDLSNVDNAYSVEHSISILSQYPNLVCNPPSSNTTARQQQVQAALISAGVKIYGYVNMGVGETTYNGCMPPIATRIALIDDCAAGGYVGIFYDGDGSIGVTQDANNYVYNHAHSKGLACMPNTHPQDTFIGTDTTTLATPTVAPVIVAATDAGSTLPPGVYLMAYTLTTYLGETPASPTASVTITSGQGIALTAITVPVYTLGVNIYLSVAPGSSTLGLVQSAYGAAATFGTLPVSGAAQPPTANTAYTNNPNGLASVLTTGDTILWESFYSRDDNQYAGVPEGGFANVFTQYQAGVTLANQYGVEICGLAYQIDTVPISDYSDWINAHVLACACGFKALCYGGNNLSNNSAPWVAPPTFPALGSRLVSVATQTSASTYDAVSDQGIIRFIATDSPITRGYKAFTSGGTFSVALSGMPTTNSTRATTTYRQSADGTTWTPTTLASVTARYFDAVIELQE